MVVKIYTSGISGNKEVKKRQQRVMMILDSKNIEYVTVDITEPGKEAEKEFMQANSNPKHSKYPLPPQLFNDEAYCGDYEDFDLANEIDELDKFLKISSVVSTAEVTLQKKQEVTNGDENITNGVTSSREASVENNAGEKKELELSEEPPEEPSGQVENENVENENEDE